MKALVGSWDHRPHRLLAENTALRTRLAQLEGELRRVGEERDRLRAAAEEGRLVDAWAAADEVAVEAEVALTAH